MTLRNDNLGENTFDTIEIFSDVGTDTYIHYFEDRSNVPEGESPFGNITDSRLWIRGLPSGTLHDDEIAAIFTTIGEAPGSVNLPGDIPDRLSLMIAIKNFSGDNTNNVNDPTLPMSRTTSMTFNNALSKNCAMVFRFGLSKLTRSMPVEARRKLP